MNRFMEDIDRYLEVITSQKEGVTENRHWQKLEKEYFNKRKIISEINTKFKETKGIIYNKNEGNKGRKNVEKRLKSTWRESDIVLETYKEDRMCI